MIDRDLPLKREISANIKKLMKERKWTQKKTSEESGISKSTLSDYINCKTLINPGNIEKLSEAFGVAKSEIDPSFKPQQSQLYTAPLNEKDQKDIAKRLVQLKEDIEHADALAFDGEPMSEEALDSFLEAMDYVMNQTKRINKKYTPKKYRKDQN